MEQYNYLKNFSIIHRFCIMYHLKELKKYQISGHQMGYIMCICKNPGISQEGIASFFGLNKGAITKGVRPLIEKGYVYRSHSQKDRRAYELYPTEKAQELHATAEEVVAKFDRLLTLDMSEEEQSMFRKLLSKACDNVISAAGDDRHQLTRPGPSTVPCSPDYHTK